MINLGIMSAYVASNKLPHQKSGENPPLNLWIKVYKSNYKYKPVQSKA